MFGSIYNFNYTSCTSSTKIFLTTSLYFSLKICDKAIVQNGFILGFRENNLILFCAGLFFTRGDIDIITARKVLLCIKNNVVKNFDFDFDESTIL